MGRLIEGVWDCQYCDSKKIRGSIRICPVCGRQRDNNVKFYMDDPHNYVAEDVARTINRNPDWICSYCDALNSDDVHTCHICEASREDSKQNYFERRAEVEARRAEKERMRKAATEGAGDSQRNNKDAYDETERTEFDYHYADHNRRGSYDNGYSSVDDSFDAKDHKPSLGLGNIRWSNIFKIGAGLLAAVMLIMGIVWMFSPKTQEVTIQDFSWERSISIEEYVTVERSGWALPADGRLLYSQREIRTYEQVLDHYETKTETYYESELVGYNENVTYKDLGNGYFEEVVTREPVYEQVAKTREVEVPVYRDEPVYATKYYYEIDVWQYAFSSNSSGNDKDPYWKEVELKELQREGGRSETYYISVVDEDDEVNKYRFDFDVWNELEKDETVTIKTTIFGDAELVVDGEVVSEAAETSQTSE